METCLYKSFAPGVVTIDDGRKGRVAVRCQNDPHPDTKCAGCGKGWCEFHRHESDLTNVGCGPMCHVCIYELTTDYT